MREREAQSSDYSKDTYANKCPVHPIYGFAQVEPELNIIGTYVHIKLLTFNYLVVTSPLLSIWFEPFLSWEVSDTDRCTVAAVEVAEAAAADVTLLRRELGTLLFIS